MTTAIRDRALAYAARGWPVFPLKPREKTPLTSTGFKEATTNPNVIERWFDRWPEANVGVATGVILKAWVLDLDGEEGSRSLTELEAELGPLPDTLDQTTGGGGRQLFFAWPDGREIRNRANLRAGVDVRGAGGYVVVPPSVHPSGRAYAWNTEETAKIAYAPKAWLDFVAPIVKAVAPWERVAAAAERPRLASSTVMRTPIVDRARRYLAEVDPAIQGSGGHDALLWAARCLVVGFELDDATALDLLWSDFNPRCLPPWNPDDEKSRRDFERKVGEARRTPAGKPVGWLLDELGLRTGEDALQRIGRESATRMLAASEAKRKPLELSVLATDMEPPAETPPAERTPFPVNLFPGPVRDYVALVSAAHDVDASFVALPALVVAGAAMGNAWRLALKESWLVPPTLWGALVGDSGTNKTAPMEEVVEPLTEPIRPELVYDTLLNPQAGMVAGDTTVEALITLMQRGKRGLLCFNDELAGWSESFDKGKKGGRGGGGGEQSWLQFWNAKRFILDRKTNSEHVEIPAAACSVLGSIQPLLLASCFDPRRFASGLVARLLIACPPIQGGPPRWRTESVTEEARAVWAGIVTWLRLTPFKGMNSNNNAYEPRVVRFDPHAQVAFERFWESVKSELRSEPDPNARTLHAKVDTHAGRLALVHHGMRIACGEKDVDAPVTIESQKAGAAWARWFLGEQRRAYGYTARVAREKDAEDLAVMIRTKLPAPVATLRQVMRLSCTRWPTAADARVVMAHAVELGHARWAGAGGEGRDKVILNDGAGVVQA